MRLVRETILTSSPARLGLLRFNYQYYSRGYRSMIVIRLAPVRAVRKLIGIAVSARYGQCLIQTVRARSNSFRLKTPRYLIL